MKRKVPHIILRFSKQVNHPARAAPSELAATKFTSPSALATMTENVTEPPATALAKPMARESSENEGAGARSDKRNRIVQSKYHERNSTHPSGSALPTSSSILPIAAPISQLVTKRKRPIPKSIGGGKGDLQPPSKKVRGSAPKQPKFQTTPTPNGTKKKDGDKRVTRSQDTQQRSELAEWFEDRDDDDDFVDIDIQMAIVPHDSSQENTSKSSPKGLPNSNVFNGTVGVKDNEDYYPPNTPAPENSETVSLGLILSTRDTFVQTVDLESEARSNHSRLTRLTADPLADYLYIKPHRGMGREEKRLRNVERDKAAYDKQRYEERLEKLRGIDWIKTFNLGGVGLKLGHAEMEKRRKVVIKWHESLLEKFKAWKEEERRQKAAKGGRLSSMTNSQERDTAEAEDLHKQATRDENGGQVDDEEDKKYRGEDEGGQGEEGTEEEEEREEGEEEGEEEEEEEEEDIYAIVDDSDDLGDNSYHSKQHRHSFKSSKGAHRLSYAESPKKKQLELKPFTSFYNKSHMRLAAISTGRKSSRNLTAFGEPLPEIGEKEFLLPDEFFYQTARHMRARRRVSK